MPNWGLRYVNELIPGNAVSTLHIWEVLFWHSHDCCLRRLHCWILLLRRLLNRYTKWNYWYERAMSKASLVCNWCRHGNPITSWILGHLYWQIDSIIYTVNIGLLLSHCLCNKHLLLDTYHGHGQLCRGLLLSNRFNLGLCCQLELR
jgi:hypothetical protein